MCYKKCLFYHHEQFIVIRLELKKVLNDLARFALNSFKTKLLDLEEAQLISNSHGYVWLFTGLENNCFLTKLFHKLVLEQ